MMKSSTCDLVLKSKLSNFTPDSEITHTPSHADPSSVPTRTPSNTDSFEGLSTQPAATVCMIPNNRGTVDALRVTSVENMLKSELALVNEQIQRAKQRRTDFTKEELKAKLQEFVPSEVVDDLPSQDLSLEKSSSKSVKSEIVRSYSQRSSPKTRDNRALSWQQTTLYE